MANPFDFSTGAVLTAAQLNQIGDWETWSPTLTNISIGNGTVTAHYAEVNEVVFFEIFFDVGSTTSFSGTSMQFSIPVTSGSSLTFNPSAGGWCRPQGGTIYQLLTVVFASGVIVPYAFQIPATYGQAVAIRGTIPETWNSDGVLYMSGTYRAS